MGKYCFGIDVGGTTVKLGLFDVSGNVLDKWEIPTVTANKGSAILPDIAESVLQKMEDKNIKKIDIAGVGIGVPGPVESSGMVHRAANLGWDTNFNIKNDLENLIGIPVKAGNDANIAALGEMWKGGGQGHKNLVAVTLGTGVGGGIIVNGTILTGAIGAAGEIGHIHIEDNETEKCGCGNYGCLEEYTSATGIVRLANRILDACDTSSVLRNGEVTSKTVFDAVKTGDEVAMEIADQFGKYLGKGLAIIASVLNPEIFVIGGGVSKAGDVILKYIDKYYKTYVFHGSKDVLFTLATLGNDAGIYGAAKLVIE